MKDLEIILLVIHETKVRESISRGLQMRGYSVASTQDGEEALTHVSQISPSVILIDLYLKNPSGLELLRRLRLQGYRGKVILLSGMSLRTEMSEAYSWGVDHVLCRPLNLDELNCAICSVLGSATSTEIHLPIS